MLSTTLLARKLQNDFPQFQFTAGNKFHWSPSEQTIYYQPDSADIGSLLHELSHAILDHRQYTRDIQLIGYEQAAWHHAQKELAPLYNSVISADQIETSLDTYRDWLHARSLCPECNATGMQIKQQIYSCLACHTKWRVNDARVCELRRSVVV